MGRAARPKLSEFRPRMPDAGLRQQGGRVILGRVASRADVRILLLPAKNAERQAVDRKRQ